MTRKTTVRWLILLALAVAGAGAIAFLLAPRPLNVETGAVGRGPVAETVSDQGWARARHRGDALLEGDGDLGLPARGTRLGRVDD
ncbi:MAG: hypothetical protein ACXWK0_14425, partial [Caulobacteraceae bacterium]